jgi:RND family efflux transporter MFP subunit
MIHPGIPFSLVLAAAGAFLAAGCGSKTGAAATTLNGARPQSPAKVLVRLGDFQRGDISSRLAVAADLEAVEAASVFPQISGVIREVRCREGDPVEKDAPVILLIDDDLRLALETKEILLAQAKTKVEQAKLAVREAEGTVAQKRLLLEKAEAEYDRLLKLAEGSKGAISLEETEAKRYDRDQARMELTAALLQVEKLALEEAQAGEGLRTAEVEVKTAAYNLSRAEVRSPIRGVVSRLDLKVGETVSSTALAFSVVNLERLEARLHVPQRDLARLRLRQEVRITCDVFPQEEFRGGVEVINPVIEKESGTVRVTVGVSDPSGLLKPGMFINGEIILDTRPNALLVPKRAVIYENQEPVIFLAVEGIARRCTVRPGYSSKDHIEVLGLTGAGGETTLAESGRLVLVGQNNLKEGSLVEIE